MSLDFFFFFLNGILVLISFHQVGHKSNLWVTHFFWQHESVGGDCFSPAVGWTWEVCICFNITIVLCFTLSLSLKNCRMVRALVTSLLSAPSEKLAGLTWPPLPLAHRATCTATKASRRSLHFMSRLALTTAKDRVPSALWSPSTLQR